MHTISQVAKQYDVTLRALRFYEEKGLLAPAREGTARLYSDDDVKRVGLIVVWVRAGMSLKHVKEALKMFDAGNEVGLETYIAVCLSRIKKRLWKQMDAIEQLQKKEAA